VRVTNVQFHFAFCTRALHGVTIAQRRKVSLRRVYSVTRPPATIVVVTVKQLHVITVQDASDMSNAAGAHCKLIDDPQRIR